MNVNLETVAFVILFNSVLTLLGVTAVLIKLRQPANWGRRNWKADAWVGNLWL